jgi:2-polyprenyl-6-methoxyphenol hydroxylase-like FAD-dependent oxidoreductase
MQEQRSGHAIVIGGSMGGLIAARVLADHVQSVTIIERDRLPSGVEQRKGVPQGKHAHGLLASGLEALSDYFPGLLDDLVADGGIPEDMGLAIRWYHLGAYKQRARTGYHGVFTSRPLLEYHVRRRVLARPNVRALDGHEVERLIADGGRVTGVMVREIGSMALAQPLSADLVVDACGRGSRTPHWLESLGFERAPESVVPIDVGYVSRIYERKPEDLSGACGIIVSPTPPNEKRVGVVFPIEGDRWLVTLGGRLGDHAEPNEVGFLTYARSLPAPDVYDIVSRARPMSEIAVHRFPANQRRHYERLTRFPDGYLVFGDAISSFNPIYGQGMTVSALEGVALDRVLGELEGGIGSAWRPFFRRAAKVVDIAWSAATGEDFRYPEVEGPRPPGLRFVHAFLDQIHRAAAVDAEVFRAFIGVMNLQRSPASLFTPSIVLRLVRAATARRRTARALTHRAPRTLPRSAQPRGASVSARDQSRIVTQRVRL